MHSLSLSSVRHALSPKAGRLLLALPLLAAACGNVTGPSKAEIKQVVQNTMQAANNKASANSLGLFEGPYDPADLDITNADCTAKENGVYRCVVTAVSKKGTHTSTLNFKKANGEWTIVE